MSRSWKSSTDVEDFVLWICHQLDIYEMKPAITVIIFVSKPRSLISIVQCCSMCTHFVHSISNHAFSCLLWLWIGWYSLSFHSPKFLENHEGLIFDKNNGYDYECTNGVVVTLKSNGVFLPFPIHVNVYNVFCHTCQCYMRTVNSPYNIRKSGYVIEELRGVSRDFWHLH